jgi:hypothetical protein
MRAIRPMLVIPAVEPTDARNASGLGTLRNLQNLCQNGAAAHFFWVTAPAVGR